MEIWLGNTLAAGGNSRQGLAMELVCVKIPGHELDSQSSEDYGDHNNRSPEPSQIGIHQHERRLKSENMVSARRAVFELAIEIDRNLFVDNRRERIGMEMEQYYGKIRWM